MAKKMNTNQILWAVVIIAGLGAAAWFIIPELTLSIVPTGTATGVSFTNAVIDEDNDEVTWTMTTTQTTTTDGFFASTSNFIKTPNKWCTDKATLVNTKLPTLDGGNSLTGSVDNVQPDVIAEYKSFRLRHLFREEECIYKYTP